MLYDVVSEIEQLITNKKIEYPPVDIVSKYNFRMLMLSYIYLPSTLGLKIFTRFFA